MKSYRECMLLSEQRKDSERDLREAQNRLTEILKVLDTRVEMQKTAAYAKNKPSRWDKIAEKLNATAEKKGKNTALGSIVVSILWIVIYFTIFAFASSVPWSGAYFMRPIMVVSCLLMGIVMLASGFMDLKYINSIMAYKEQIQQMIRNLELSAASLTEKERAFFDAGSKGFDYPLLEKQEKSVVSMGLNIRETVSSMEKFSSKYLEIAKTVLYYVTMVCVTIVCAAALQGTVNYVVYNSFEFVPSTGVYIAVVLAVIAAQVFIGRRFWAMTNCSVSNLTLLMTVSGPILLGLVILGLIIVGGVIMLVLYLMGIALVAALACGFMSGG